MNILLRVLFVGLLSISISGCGVLKAMNPFEGLFNGGGGGNGGGDDAGDEPAIPAGSVALLTAVSATSEGSFNVGSGSLTLSAGYSYIYRYITDTAALTRFDDTLNIFNSNSCDDQGHEQPVTVGDVMYSAEFCPSVDGSDSYAVVDLEKLDIETGDLASAKCAFTQVGATKNFCVIGDEIFYRNSSGDLMVQNIDCSGETELIPNNVNNNSSSYDYYSVAGQLISVYDDTSASQYLVHSRSTETGLIQSLLTTVDTVDVAGQWAFFEGDGALYWFYYEFGNIKVVRYPLTGEPEVIMSAAASSEPTNGNIVIDESGEKVLLAFRDSGEETFILYNISDGTSEELTDLGTDFAPATMSRMQLFVY